MSRNSPIKARRFLGSRRADDSPVAAVVAPPQRLEFWKPVALVALGFFVSEDVPTVQHANRLLFGRTAQAAQVGQPMWLWPEIPPEVTFPELERRADHTLLHRYRVGYQTVGQPWLLRPPRAPVPEIIEPDAVRIDHSQRLFYGRAGSAVQIGQPWLMWQSAKLEPEYIAEAQRVDHNRLHRYRVGYQTVGQSWQMWPKGRMQAELEEFSRQSAVDLSPFRGQYPAVAGGQPWYFWKAPRPEVIAEADAVRVDYSAYFFNRSTGAVVPGVGTEWIIRARRRKGR